MDTCKVLIVEDEAIVAMELKFRLTKLGYSVCGTASSGLKALQLANEHRPDIVLMDVRIKGKMDGIETADILKKDLGIPSIFLSAFSDDDTKEQMIATDNYEHLQKPFGMEALQEAIKKTLGNNHSKN